MSSCYVFKHKWTFSMAFMSQLIFPFEAESTPNFSHTEDKKFKISFSSLATRFTFLGLKPWEL